MIIKRCVGEQNYGQNPGPLVSGVLCYRVLNGDKKMYARTGEGDFILPMMQDALRTIMEAAPQLAGRCEAMLAALDGPLAALLDPSYDELNPPKKEYRLTLGDTVYLGAQEYELLAYDEQTARLYDPTFPISIRNCPVRNLTACWRRTR